MRNLLPQNTPHMLATIIGCVTLTACGGGSAPEAALPVPPAVSAPILAGAPAASAPATTAAQTFNSTQVASNGLLLTPTTVLKPITVALGAQITDVRFENTGAAQSSVPVTFGHVFAVGAVRAVDAVVGKLPDGTLVPLQVDIKATHPDGSLRHAVISAVLPSLAATQTQTMALVKTTPYAANSPTEPSALLASGFTAAATVTLNGLQYSASADALLKSGKVTTWLAGPIATEWHVWAPLKSAQGLDHPHLTARYAIRHYKGSKKTRVDVTIENNWTYEPAPQNLTYDAQIVIGGQPVYTKAAMTHYHHARWRKLFWWGGEPMVHIKHNTAYLLDSKALPNFDRNLKISETVLAGYKSGWTGAKTEPMGVGMANPYMPSTGGRADIGLLPGWAAAYLLSMDKRAKDVTLGTADLAGSWSMHFRNKKTDRPVSIIDYPYMTILGNPNDTYNPNTKLFESFPQCATTGGCNNSNTSDTAHQPAFAYLPYLVTGDYFYLEELQFWTMFSVLMENPWYRQYAKGLVLADQVRGQAWSLRNISEAQYITPDNDPLKSHFISILDSNIDWYTTTYVTNPAANTLGVLTHGLTLHNHNRTDINPWMDDFFTSAIGHTVELGVTKALPLLKWKAKFPIDRMVGQGACWVDAAIYIMKVRDSGTGVIFPTIGEAYRANHTDAVNAMACGSAEMAAVWNMKVGEMTGYSYSTVGYPSNMQPALAYSANVGGAAGMQAWSLFMARSVKPDYDTSPQFAIVPR